MTLLLDRTEPRWYQRAVFYEVLVRGFFDGNNDGTGDLQGITAKLDYLEWLGVDCLWLLPFYQSPLRDGGYDISDFWTVLPEYGDLADAVELVEEAHRRGISDHRRPGHEPHQRPAPVVPGVAPGPRPTPKPTGMCGATTTSASPRPGSSSSTPRNPTGRFDPQRGQYYWHRFFSHQPDLNYDNPEVADAMLDVVRYWLDIGLDGFRLDAVPYLFERDGTNGENLPETHEYLKRVRKEVDAVPRPGAAGRGQPVARGRRRVLRRRRRMPHVLPLSGHAPDVHGRAAGAALPHHRDPRPDAEIPDGCQWGIFLRNHDELTLEMVTDEERDYMWTEYAKDPRMKRNIGIGRRLAPLVDNDRRVAELLHALLFSFPGSPSSTTATRSAWGTTSTSATVTGCGPPCSGRPTAMPASAGPTSPSCTCPP